MSAPDPRGPLRTVAEVTQTPTGNLVRFAECGHVGTKNPTMMIRAGEQSRCFACVEEGEG